MNAYSAQRNLRVAIAAKFRGAPSLANVVHENRPLPLPSDALMQVHVNYVESGPTDQAISGHPIDWDTAFETTVKARSDTDTSAEDRADAVWRSLYERLMAEQTLGGLVSYLEPGPVSVTDDEAEADVCTLTWRFTVRHSTGNNTLDPR